MDGECDREMIHCILERWIPLRSSYILTQPFLSVSPSSQMDQIKSHPWFTRRAPRPQPAYIAPPTPDQITKAIGTANQLDYDIVSNLQTLWFAAKEESIVEALVSDELSRDQVLILPFYLPLLPSHGFD